MSSVRATSSVSYEVRYKVPGFDDGFTFIRALDAQNHHEARQEVQSLIDQENALGGTVEILEITSIITITSTVREAIPFQ